MNLTELIAEKKRQIVAARRAGDDERAAILSGEQAILKKKFRERVCECGQPKSYRNLMCWLCRLNRRYARLAPAVACALVLLACSCFAQDSMSLIPKPRALSLTNSVGKVFMACTNCPPKPAMTNFVISWTPGTNNYSYQIWQKTNLASPYWYFLAWITNRTAYTNKNDGSQQYFVVFPFTTNGFRGPVGKAG